MRKPTRPMEEILKQMYRAGGRSELGAWFDPDLKGGSWRFASGAQAEGLEKRGLVELRWGVLYLTPKGEMYAKKLFAEECGMRDASS